MCYLTGWVLVCLCTSHKSMADVRAPVMDYGTWRALCHYSSWKSEQKMCRYTCKMVGGMFTGQFAQVLLKMVRESCHI